MTPEENSDALPLEDEITEKFLSEYRADLRPDIEAYCQQYPELAVQLRPLLSTAMILENVRSDQASPFGNRGNRPAWDKLGDYRLIRQAGSGGMGVVYEAIQESLGRRVAIKTLPTDLTRVQSQLERFLREARAVASLHHTNIVPVFAVGEDHGVRYFVMPFIDGIGIEKVLAELRTLARQAGHLRADVNADSVDRHAETVTQATADDLAASQTASRVRSGEPPLWISDSTAQPAANPAKPPFSIGDIYQRWLKGDSNGNPTSAAVPRSQAGRGYWQFVADIGLQVADAMDYAIRQGVLHRDIKPSNLLLDRDGIVWVTDFGLAKTDRCSNLTPKGEMLGTLRYLAPERLRGIHDLRGDIYGLGLTLYELLTLTPPFDTHERPQLTKQILECEPLQPRKIDPRIPIDLETIVQKSIAKDPQDRYQSAESLADDLRLFLENRPIRARRISSLERSWRWCRRNPVTAALLGCTVVLMVMTIVVLSLTNARIRDETTEKASALAAKDSALRDREAALHQSQANLQLANSRFYAAKMNLAGHAFDRGEVTRAEDLLSSVMPSDNQRDFRGFEWFYLTAALHEGLKRTLEFPGNEITCLSFAADGRRLLIAGGNQSSGFACLVDIDTGEKMIELSQLRSNVNGCAYAPDGSAFAIGTGDGQLQLFDAKTFQRLHTENTGLLIKSMAWSPNSKLLVVGSESGELRCWQMPELIEASIPEAHQGPILRLFFSSDSTRLYSSADWGREGKISRQWNATTLPPQLMRAFENESISDESPDGRTLVAINGGVLQIVDAGTGQVVNKASISTGPLVSARFHADGQSLVVAARNDRAVRTLDASSLEKIEVTAQRHTASALAIGPRGHFWAAGDARGEVRVWDLHQPRPLTEFDDPNIRSAFCVANQSDIVIGGSGPSRRWSLADGRIRPFHQAKNLRVMSRDAKTLVGVIRGIDGNLSDTIEIWRDGLAKPATIVLPSPIYQQCLAISASGRWLATRVEGQPIAIYDLSQSPPKQVHSLASCCYAMAFTPDQRRLIVGEQYGSVACFDVESGAKQSNFAGFDSFWAWSMSIAVSNDNRYVASGSESGTVSVWESNSRKLVATLIGQPGEIRSIIFFPDGQRLAVGGTGDVRIWNFQSGQELLALPVKGGYVTSLAVNTEGDVLIAVTPDGHVQAWLAKES